MRVGTGRADLAFPDGLGLYGFGPFGGRGVNVPLGSADHDTLQARALYIEHDTHKLLVVSFDLGSGSRVVHQAIIDALERRGMKLLPGQLWIVGTHTHAAPGHYLGTLYDAFGQYPFGHKPSVVAELVRGGLEAALSALAEPVPCRVGVATEHLWGAGRNRSFRPFLANFGGDLTAWTSELLELGIKVPADATPEEQAVDPRLTVVAFVGEDQRPLATWATWCCHPATIRRAWQRAYHRDWPGVAVDLVEKKAQVPFAMIHQGAAGDVTPLPSGAVRERRPMERVRALGEAISGAWQRAFEAAASRAEETSFELGFKMLAPHREGLPTFEIGSPVTVGSEEFDPFFPTKHVGEARLFPWRWDAQQPKMPALGPLHYPLRRFSAFQPSPEHPMWLLRIGEHLFFASPFEQTTYAARTLEERLHKTWKAVRKEALSTISPVGLVGDYAGYLTTPKEFALQNYEGAHTIYGRDQLEVVGRVWTSIIRRSSLNPSAPAIGASERTLRARAERALDLT